WAVRRSVSGSGCPSRRGTARVRRTRIQVSCRARTPRHQLDRAPVLSPFQGCGMPSSTVSGRTSTVSSGGSISTAVSRSATVRWNSFSLRKRCGRSEAMARGASGMRARLRAVPSSGTSVKEPRRLRPVKPSPESAERRREVSPREKRRERTQRVGEVPETYSHTSTSHRPTRTSSGAQARRSRRRRIWAVESSRISPGGTREAWSSGSRGGGGRSRSGGRGRAYGEVMGSSDRAATQEGAAQRHLVGVVEIATDGQAGGEAGDGQLERGQQAGEIGGGGLALDVRVQREDHLGGLAGAEAAHELGDAQVVGAHAADGVDRAAEHVVAALELADLLDRDDVLGLLDHADHLVGAARVGADAALLLRG